MILLIAMFSMMMMVKSSPPMKLSFSLVALSLGVSSQTYSSCSSVFPSCALIISFSSGMMILFCYCSTMSNYENKSNPFSLYIMVPLMLVLVTWTTMESPMTQSIFKKCLMELNNPMLMMMMGIVLCCMVAINTTMVNPCKQLMSSL